MIDMKHLMTSFASLALCCAILPVNVSAQQGILTEEEPNDELPVEPTAAEELSDSNAESNADLSRNYGITIEVQPFQHCQLVVRTHGEEIFCNPYGSSIPPYAGEEVELEVIPEETETKLYAIDIFKAGTPDGHVPEGSLKGNLYSFTMPDYWIAVYVEMKEGLEMIPCDHGSFRVTSDDRSYDFPAYVINAEPDDGYITAGIKAECQSGDVIDTIADRNTVVINRNLQQEAMIYVSASFEKPHMINIENCEYANIRTMAHGSETDQAGYGDPVRVEITDVNPLYE